MKIHGQATHLNTPLASRLDGSRPVDGKPGDSSTTAATGDQVSVSADAQLARSAVSAATQSPDIRPDVVARAKALLDAGEVGKDAGALADKLIDRTIDS